MFSLNIGSNSIFYFRSVRNYLSAKRKLRGYSQEEPEDSSKKCSKKCEKSEEKSPGK